MSKTVEKIILKNFKAFRQEQIVDFKNKNVLIYGNNGAGKSSIFWALYTFLQSSIKSKDGVEKYFKVFDVNNIATHQSLRNVFEGAGETAYIELTVKDGEDLKTYRIPAQATAAIEIAEAQVTPAEVDEIAPENISAAQVEQVKVEDISDAVVVEVPVDLSPITPTVSETVIGEPIDTNIKLLNTTSDFINYKLLSGFYRDSHKYDVNLWSVFERDIFPFIIDNVDDKTFLEKIIDNTSDVERYENTGYKLREGW